MQGQRNTLDGQAGDEVRQTAARLVAAVDAYRLEVAHMPLAWDPESYRGVADLFRDLQQEVARLPTSYAAWVEVLITRFEFTQALWDLARSRDATAAREVQQRHLLAVQKLRDLCASLRDAR